MKTSEFCVAEFRAADRRTEEHGTLILTPPAAAGWLLCSNNQDVCLSIARCPVGFSWWNSKVLPILRKIQQEN